MDSSASIPFYPSLKRCIGAGICAGAAAAVVGNIAYALLRQATALSFPELTWLSISRASLMASVLGGMVFYAAARWSKHPVAWFAVAGLIVTTADSIMVMLYPPHPAFDRVANPLHYIVALTVILILPKIARGQEPMKPAASEPIHPPAQ